MSTRKIQTIVIAFIAIAVFTTTAARAGAANTPQASQAHIIREVRHELATLPYYSVYDWLQFEVTPDNTVILRGQVVRPTTKSDAEARVKEIDGVSKVINNIEVLPLSPNDDRLRMALYRAIYNWNPPLPRHVGILTAFTNHRVEKEWRLWRKRLVLILAQLIPWWP